MGDGKLRVDLEVEQLYKEAERFLTLLDPGAESFTFQTFDEDKDRKDPSLVRVIHGSLNDVFYQLCSLNDRGAGIFVTINETNLSGRKASDIVRVRALFADLDGAPKPIDFLTPTIEVETSDQRWHLYYLVSDIELKEFTAKQKGLIARFGSDPSVHDLPRVMRLPGFFHKKAEPWMVLITAESDAAYTGDQFPNSDDDLPEHLRDYVPDAKGTGFPKEPPSPWQKLNAEALANPEKWIFDLFGSRVKRQAGGEYRVSSKSLGRKLQEDLVIYPTSIKDFGEADQGDEKQGWRSPLDVVMKFSEPEKDLAGATEWLRVKLHGPSGGTASPGPGAGTGKPSVGFELFWHGKKYDRPLRAWLVKDLIFEKGTGIAAGQWGTAKTFGVLDLSASVMTGTLFAGREIVRRGGVLFIAAEGANEVPIRLHGIVERKLKPEADRAIAAGAEPPTANLDELPFAWIEDCPNLQNDASFTKLLETVKEAKESIRTKFDLPLALTVIDTMSMVGNFKDADDTAENQLVMNRLAEVSRVSEGFVLVVDHFGKSVETGTRNSSVKEDAVEVILVWLADRELTGAIHNSRMALRKLKGGRVGMEFPFDLKVVDAGEGETTCVIEWKAEGKIGGGPGTKDRWPRSLKVFRSAMETAIGKHGEAMRPHGKEGDEVKAVPNTKVREEFATLYPADGDTPAAKQEAKKKAFKRARQLAQEKELICCREIGGIDYLWLIHPEEPLEL